MNLRAGYSTCKPIRAARKLHPYHVLQRRLKRQQAISATIFRNRTEKLLLPLEKQQHRNGSRFQVCTTVKLASFALKRCTPVSVPWIPSDNEIQPPRCFTRVRDFSLQCTNSTQKESPWESNFNSI